MLVFIIFSLVFLYDLFFTSLSFFNTIFPSLLKHTFFFFFSQSHFFSIFHWILSKKQSFSLFQFTHEQLKILLIISVCLSFWKSIRVTNCPSLVKRTLLYLVLSVLVFCFCFLIWKVEINKNNVIFKCVSTRIVFLFLSSYILAEMATELPPSQGDVQKFSISQNMTKWHNIFQGKGFLTGGWALLSMSVHIYL